MGDCIGEYCEEYYRVIKGLDRAPIIGLIKGIRGV